MEILRYTTQWRINKLVFDIEFGVTKVQAQLVEQDYTEDEGQDMFESSRGLVMSIHQNFGEEEKDDHSGSDEEDE
jgi:hypothetical protein